MIEFTQELFSLIFQYVKLWEYFCIPIVYYIYARLGHGPKWGALGNIEQKSAQKKIAGLACGPALLSRRVFCLNSDLHRELAGAYHDITAEEYLTTRAGAEIIVEKLKGKLTGGLLKDMYASPDRRSFARGLMEGYFMDELKGRRHIDLPTGSQMSLGLRAVLEELADEKLA